MYRTNAKYKLSTPLSEAPSVPWWKVNRHFRAWIHYVPHKRRVSELTSAVGLVIVAKPQGACLYDYNELKKLRYVFHVKIWLKEYYSINRLSFALK